MIYQDSSTNWSEDVNDWIQYSSKKYVDLSLSVIDSSISNIDSSISTLRYKTSDIQRIPAIDDRESIILATDDNVEITSVSVEKINDDKEGIVLATDDNVEITSIDIEKVNDDNEVIEFSNESNTETYAKIGVVDDKKGIFVDSLFDLNGNPLLQIDSSNDILILAGKKYKMIPYIEQ